MEKTLVLVKPDGVAKGLTGEIIARFERRGLTLAALKMLKLTKDKAEIHYAEHKERPFFGELVVFITSGPIVAMVISGENAVKIVRAMMGPTNPADAAPGTVRGDYALSIGQNIIHGSDSPASAAREIEIYFAPDELVN
ncbi:nucleoside-diphosphate kinase [Anaeroselena agilis]|uniref:Nucleoside diphosphate kinase n=1 Tax=Anaeroselena agilis TaxID=3063788 RepID=A0ABU3NWN8_9FIRM|nr:nucleoside-diphosphate kinase [Selenomonadales bacterium 4137-cl]